MGTVRSRVGYEKRATHGQIPRTARLCTCKDSALHSLAVKQSTGPALSFSNLYDGIIPVGDAGIKDAGLVAW